MPDFLSRLAGRTLGLAPTVQPMIVPMYAAKPPLTTESADLMLSEAEATPLAEQEYPFSAEAGSTRPASVPGYNPVVAQEEYQQGSEGIYEQARGKQQPVPSTRRNNIHLLSITMPELDEAISPTMAPLQVASTSTQASPQASMRTASLQGDTHPVHDTMPPSFSAVDGDIVSSQVVNTPLAQEPLQSVASVPTAHLIQDDSLPERNSTNSPVQAIGDTHAYSRTRVRETHNEQRAIDSVLAAPEVVLEEMQQTLPPRRSLLPPEQRMSFTTRNSSSGRAGVRRVDAAAIQAGPNETIEMMQATPTVPAIQVTIGRIEVRATPPPPARPAAPRTPPTVMNLDDYVNQRMKGDR